MPAQLVVCHLCERGLIPHGPALAAVIIIALSAGRQGLREFWRRCTNLRAGWWYLAGPAIVATYLSAAFTANRLYRAVLKSEGLGLR